MIHVTKTEEATRTTVTVDGDLSSDSVAVVEGSCREAESYGKPVQLFLRDVTTLDKAGEMLLRRLAARGVQIVARGVYTSYLVQSFAPEKAAPGNSLNVLGRHS